MISILIPIYNRSTLFPITMDSILKQSYEDWECIIVDDGSDDGTWELISKMSTQDQRVKVFKRPDSMMKGPSACRNYAFSKSNGDFIQYFDSDDIMHPDHLKLKINEIGGHDLIVCQLKEFSGSFKGCNSYSEKQYLKSPEHPFDSFVSGAFPMMMVAPLWRKNSIEPYLPIREDMHILEDHEFYARALKDIGEVVTIDRDLIYYRVGSASSTYDFYRDIDKGLDSYFEAKKTVLRLTQKEVTKLAILKMTLGFFRQALAERNFTAAQKCLTFIKEQQLCYSKTLKSKFYRIVFFYKIFKMVKKGDTMFKFLFKL